MTLWQQILKARKARRQRLWLCDLPDDTLKDIGLDRQRVRRESDWLRWDIGHW